MFWESGLFWLSALLGSAVPIALIGGLIYRSVVTRETEKGNIVKGKGIGWQFIRYTVIGIALPITGVLALNNVLTGEAATIIAGSMGYAFGQSTKDEK